MAYPPVPMSWCGGVLRGVPDRQPQLGLWAVLVRTLRIVVPVIVHRWELADRQPYPSCAVTFEFLVLVTPRLGCR